MSSHISQNINMNHLAGSLTIFIGPMYAGKSSKLISLYNESINRNENILVLTHSSENRYSDTQLSTHDQNKITCIKSSSIESFINDNINSIENCNSILIDEAQFFKDLINVLNLVEKYNKQVTIFGLDGDFERKKFGNILDLIPLCDKVEKIKATCNNCTNPAIFSHRIIPEKEQIVIGSANMYVPLCRKCYLNNTINKTI